MSDLTVKQCDSCQRTNYPDSPPEKKCGPTKRFFVHLNEGGSPYYMDICDACAAQRPINTLVKLARAALCRMSGRPEPEQAEE